MAILRVGFVLAVLAFAGVSRAAEIQEPCKNHYILDAPCVPASRGAAVRISKLYSTMDGEWQAIELDVDTASGLPLKLGGRRVMFFDAGGLRRTQVLAATWDGPVRRGKLLLSNHTSDLMGVEYGLAELAFPRHALPNGGGRIEIEGMDAWSFGPLPLDGRSALARDGSIVPAVLERYVPGTMQYGTLEAWDFVEAIAREYYHATLDHYLLTANLAEIELLEAGAIPGWVKTGAMIGVFARPLLADDPLASLPVCRVLLRYDGGYSHAMSSNPSECEALASDPAATLESPAMFYTATPDPKTGACPDQLAYDVMKADGVSHYRAISGVPMTPVYRLWNGHPQANHRLIVEGGERNRLTHRGWVPYGYGPEGVALCADWASSPR